VSLVRIAAERKTEGLTYLVHSPGRQVSQILTQPLLRYGYHIVKIHRARALHTIMFVQHDFRGNTSDARRDWCDSCRRQVLKSSVAAQYYDRPGLVRRRKTVKSNVAPGYSSGQIASASQADKFSESLGPAS
jgi:hypothetical protein